MKNYQDIEIVLKNLNIPKFRSKQIVNAVCHQGKTSYEQIANLPKILQTILKEQLPLFSLKPILHVKSAKKDTEKVLFETIDQHKIEAVLMIYKDGRHSVCISSQAGCQMGCKFCATGTMKFGRNLSYEEIFDQVLYFQQYLLAKQARVSNVIYMGMGEPMMNYDNVIKSIEIINHPDFLNLGARKITVSTSGLIDGINKLTEFPLQVNLALSLHAPNQELRASIMPVARRWKLDELLASIDNYIEKTHRRVSYEYVMLKDINDSSEIAEQLADISQNKLIHVNIIPYNNTDIAGISGTERAKIQNFQNILINRGVNATVRTTMGEDIAAACGQLANKNK